jgi:DNA repair protein RecN (Recombination protein N)
VEELARYDARFQDSLVALDAARIAAEDAGATLRDYAGGINASPERLAEIQDRLAVLDRLKRKYGDTLEAVITYSDEVTRKLSEMENKDEVLRRLRGELDSAGQRYLSAARAVSRQRSEGARKLEKLVEQEVNDLAMKARFLVQVASCEQGEWAAFGIDQVRYLISANPGEPLRPVEEIASGGELSRVMLALNATVEGGNGQRRRKHEPQRTMVFDEIDTGIGGRAAEAVGKKLKQLAGTSQVLCITHLPQIACFADYHYVIEKKESAGRSRTSIRRLNEAERRDELARMLSGAKVTDTSRKHAEQLLKTYA